MYAFIGLLGVIVIITTYFLLQIDKIDSKSFSYSILNIVGSFFIIISLNKDWNLSAFIIEFFWIIISVYGIYKYFRRVSLCQIKN